ncbi:hypothetical protein BH10PSE6_BH10PSE6_55510 [soil metagenome]
MIPRGLPYDEAMRRFRWNVPERFNIVRDQRHQSCGCRVIGGVFLSQKLGHSLASIRLRVSPKELQLEPI